MPGSRVPPVALDLPAVRRRVEGEAVDVSEVSLSGHIYRWRTSAQAQLQVAAPEGQPPWSVAVLLTGTRALVERVLRGEHGVEAKRESTVARSHFQDPRVFEDYASQVREHLLILHSTAVCQSKRPLMPLSGVVVLASPARLRGQESLEWSTALDDGTGRNGPVPMQEHEHEHEQRASLVG